MEASGLEIGGWVGVAMMLVHVFNKGVDFLGAYVVAKTRDMRERDQHDHDSPSRQAVETAMHLPCQLTESDRQKLRDMHALVCKFDDNESGGPLLWTPSNMRRQTRETHSMVERLHKKVVNGDGH